ncbi:carbohydrate ABC transporter permease [Mycoplasma phocimorsus]|uniref:Carbohydrate ABC transporter permease n=1 Tax=Mycoplasma phocimorsus TaxID=3045839 RepID=A0AAJ1PTM0_9MOLU|nr:carbohydrate ABC transporter permease [Mycoplasma phocimorsus]MDJ1645967.1 carbohydrate ABC transporter permease [Mycoplasma phocimorsus]MDJ1646253.1 carbohydrate ABC transporter permease [Mycoplasma phocimorsus]MDJ1646855.1 carbohydrate ABC transporter permease [Mycoplasma phocimorsus]MDJ1647824.1 carbohydrate ABC transporter permease [Mycoplasma phocimorsus]MDJ1648477.1 carbohydrate ABC transporter permease [Mycoplasma phocimorsus]
MFEIKLKRQLKKFKSYNDKIKEKTNNAVRETSLLYLLTTSFFKIFVLVFFGLLIIFPFAFMILLSLMPDHQAENLKNTFSFFPEDFGKNAWMNYKLALNLEYFSAFGLTFANVVFSVTVKIFLTMLAGYAFSIKKWRGKEVLWVLLLSLLILPDVALLSGQYKVIKLLESVKITNKFFNGFIGRVMIIGIPFVASVFNILMFRNAFSMIPSRIKEVAAIDGVVGYRYLFKIAAPMVMPTTLTVVILTALVSWNAYLWPNLVAGTDYKIMSVWLFSVGRVDRGGTVQVLSNVKMAGTIASILPMFIFFFLSRKKIMGAVSRQGSAIKG